MMGPLFVRRPEVTKMIQALREFGVREVRVEFYGAGVAVFHWEPRAERTAKQSHAKRARIVTMCMRCGEPIPDDLRSDAEFCSPYCSYMAKR